MVSLMHHLIFIQDDLQTMIDHPFTHSGAYLVSPHTPAKHPAFAQGRIHVQISGAPLRFFCRHAVRAEGGAGISSESREAAACRQALSVDKGSFRCLWLKKFR